MKVAEEVKTKVAEAVKTISVVGLMTILLTIVIWFAAKETLAPVLRRKGKGAPVFCLLRHLLLRCSNREANLGQEIESIGSAIVED